MARRAWLLLRHVELLPMYLGSALFVLMSGSFARDLDFPWLGNPLWFLGLRRILKLFSDF